MSRTAVVVDLSLAARWVLPEDYAGEATALLIAWERRSVRRLAPVLFLSEIGTPMLRRRRDGTMTAEETEQAVAAVLALMTIVPEDAGLTGRARAIADGLGLRNAYDSLYVALAEREGCAYWTGDERFYNAAHGQFPWIHWVGE